MAKILKHYIDFSAFYKVQKQKSYIIEDLECIHSQILVYLLVA